MNEQITSWATGMMAAVEGRRNAANAETVSGLVALRDTLDARYIEIVHRYNAVQDGEAQPNNPNELPLLAGEMDGLRMALAGLDALLIANLAAVTPSYGD